MSVQLTVSIPETAFSILRTSPTDFFQEMKKAAVVKWYELGKVSQSKASEILEISRTAFLDVLKQYNVSPFQLNAADIEKELANE